MPGVKPIRIALLLAAACLLPLACAHEKPAVRDAAYVEILRVKISKVRNAIEETREAIVGSRGASYLPELYLRLAELMSEEARYHHRVAFEREQRSSETLHVPEVRLLKEQAIGVYKQILRDFPDSVLADKVLFNIGHEHRELGNFDQMREFLQRLIREHPSSPLKSEALLVLGDYHFDRGELEQSRTYYEKITDSRPGRVTELAYYKLAWVWVNLAECDKALAAFEGALEAARKADERRRKEASASARARRRGGERKPEAPAEAASEAAGQSEREGEGARTLRQGIDVPRAALVDLVYCYSQERKAEDAVDYLRGLSRNRANYVAALEKMARRYGVMNEAAGSIAVLRDLLRLAPSGEERLDDVRQLHEAARARKKYDGVGEDVRLMGEAFTAYLLRIDVTDKKRKELSKQFELYIRDLLTRAQDRMERITEKSRPAFAADLARGYEVYVRLFPESRQLTGMMLNMADVLTAAGDPLGAGHCLLRLATALPENDAERDDALYDAVVHLQDYLRSTAIETGHLDRALARSALRRAATEMLRYPMEEEKQRLVKFAVAMSLYDEGLFSEAIDRLTAVAYEYPGSEESKAAIRLVLDSYNSLNEFESLIQAARRFLAAGSPADEELRQQIRPIVAAAEQRMLDEVSLEAAGDEGGGLPLLVAIAEKNRGTELGERALLNAFVATRAQGDTAQLYKLGGMIASSYPQSEQLPGILSSLGQMALARFEIRRAIEFLGRAVQINHPQKVRLLVAAGELHEQLGNLSQARESYLDAIRSSEVRERAEALAHLARLLERQGDTGQMVSQLTPYLDDGNHEVLSVVGLALVERGETARAEELLQSVLAAGTTAPPTALARAHFGMAEIMFGTLQQYPALQSLEITEEYISVVDVTRQSYLNAAREGSPEYTPVALGRLALMMERAAEHLAAVDITSEGLPEKQQKQITDALRKRAQDLERTAREARGACVQQVYALRAFHPAARECLQDRSSGSALFAFDPVRGRSGGTDPGGVEELRSKLSLNPEDLDSLRELGERFLKAGEPHYARLVFSAAEQRGGGALESNLLGIANHAVGDEAGALAAFSRAADGGLEAGRQNLASLLRALNLPGAAKAALERFAKGREGGRLLGVGK
jgi:tetratricopeptide (TPR) repeat protein